MCKCTPSIRTPWCGKPGCEEPVKAGDPVKLTDEGHAAFIAVSGFNLPRVGWRVAELPNATCEFYKVQYGRQGPVCCATRTGFQIHRELVSPSTMTLSAEETANQIVRESPGDWRDDERIAYLKLAYEYGRVAGVREAGKAALAGVDEFVARLRGAAPS